MNLISISDLHGRNVWQQLDPAAYDRIVFLGDYVDSYVESDETIYNNLKALIAFKRKYPRKVVLLLGNHDAHYLHFPHYRCSGFRDAAQPALSTLFTRYAGLFQIAHQEGRYLFTHAGVTSAWLARLLTQTNRELDGADLTPKFDLAGLLNAVHQQPLRVRNVLFEVGPLRGGRDLYSGPVWADRSETRTNYLPHFHQIVGHTPTPDFLTVGNLGGSITYTDVLQTKTAFYELYIRD